MNKPVMTTFDAGRFVEASAQAHGLVLSTQECIEVAAQLSRIHEFARLAFEVPLSADDELAPRFEP